MAVTKKSLVNSAAPKSATKAIKADPSTAVSTAKMVPAMKVAKGSVTVAKAGAGPLKTAKGGAPLHTLKGGAGPLKTAKGGGPMHTLKSAPLHTLKANL